jgi:hypothetical protein
MMIVIIITIIIIINFTKKSLFGTGTTLLTYRLPHQGNSYLFTEEPWQATKAVKENRYKSVLPQGRV